ncbi:hypothetical protein C8F01DRAFT_1185876 [Mycena amicta]|nr:hypothetical protein C8F01DRAFT_1185876 [Mycena amicta]
MASSRSLINTERTLRRETLDSEIHATLTRAVQLKTESERLLQKLPDLKAARNALVPIESLPVEVLTAILALVPGLPLDAIMFVSRRWYTICTSSAYSKNTIRSLEIGWLDVPVAVLDLSPTLRSITISGDMDSMPFFAETLCRLALPNVCTFSLTQALLPQLPALKAFSLSGISMPYRSWRSLSALTELYLSSCYPLPLPLLFCVLRQSPNIRSLKLTDILSSDEPPRDLLDDPQPVHLGSLEKLDVSESDNSDMLDAIITRMTFPWTTSVAVSILFPAQTTDDLNGVLALAREHMRAPGQRTGDTLQILTQSDPDSSALTLEVYSSTAQNSIFCCAFSADREEEEDMILALLDVITGPQTSHLDLVNTRRAPNTSWDTILSRLPPLQKISLNPSRQSNLPGLFTALCDSAPETLPNLQILDIHFVHPDSLDLTFLASLLDFLLARQSACGKALPQMHIRIPAQQKDRLRSVLDDLADERSAGMHSLVGNLEWNLLGEAST